MGEAARGYSWPTATDGNTIAETHGAHSAARWRPLAEQLAAEVVESAPWLSRPSFRLTVLAWAAAESKAALVDDFLDRVGLLTEKGDPRPANNLADRLHARAAHLRAAMGLDPASFGRLLVTFAAAPGAEDALAALQAEGRRLVEAHQDHAAALEPGTAGNRTTERASAPEIDAQAVRSDPGTAG
jgi:hypothetical protein